MKTTAQKATRADAGLDGDRAAELDQRAQQRFHEDVDHRPAADPGDDVDRAACARAAARRRPPRDRPSWVAISMTAEADQLEHRHQDAGEEHQQRQRIHPRGQQLLDAAQDGAGLRRRRAGSRSAPDRRWPGCRGWRRRSPRPRCATRLSGLRSCTRTSRSAGSGRRALGRHADQAAALAADRARPEVERRRSAGIGACVWPRRSISSHTAWGSNAASAQTMTTVSRPSA